MIGVDLWKRRTSTDGWRIRRRTGKLWSGREIGGPFVDWEQTKAWADVISKLAPLGTLCIACVGAIYTMKQFERAKRVRAVDLAISLIGQLDTVPELAFACQALDWGAGPLIVPERYRPLLKTPGVEGRESVVETTGIVQHSVKLMASALRPTLTQQAFSEPLGLVYRYCFDKLFQYFDNIERLVESDQVALRDLGALTYWLSRLARYEYSPPGMTQQEMFQPFLKDEDYNYRRVIRLGEMMGVKGWDYPALKV